MARLPRLDLNRGPDARGHPYPIAVSLQAQQLLQGTMFQRVMQSSAVNKCMQSPRGLDSLRAGFIEQGGSNELWEECYGYLEKYGALFSHIGFQDVVIQMASHWDWFVRRLAGFLLFAVRESGGVLSQADAKSLRRLGRAPVDVQLSQIRRLTQLEIPLDSPVEHRLLEMFAVRHLGVHNRWEVDDEYLSKEPDGAWECGDLRLASEEETDRWHSDLTDVMRDVAGALAVHYIDVDDYDEFA